VDAETAVDTGTLEADEDAEFWRGLDLVRGTERSKLVGIGSDESAWMSRRGCGRWMHDCYSKGNMGGVIFIPIADLAHHSLRTGRCRSAFGVRGAVGHVSTHGLSSIVGLRAGVKGNA
jgi:hypothetical protein